MLKKIKPEIVCAVLAIILMLPGVVYAECAKDIIGKWQQTHVVFGENKVNDDSQSWEFMKNGKVRFVKTSPAIDVSGNYSCEGDIIYMKGSAPGRLKILAHNEETMAWESLDHGGGITHIKRVK